MKYSRQNYIDTTHIDAIMEGGCTHFQMKEDGIWSTCELTPIAGGQIFCRYYSRNNNLKHSCSIPNDCKLGQTITLVGEFMFGSEWSQTPERKGKFRAFDVWEYRDKHYHVRHDLVCKIVKLLDNPLFTVVENRSISQRDAFWNQLVATGEYEGMVYRNLTDTWDDPVLREKLLITQDVRVVGLNPGDAEGKYSETLGALRVVLCLDETIETTIGGGLSDEERDAIWQNPDDYIGKVCEVAANKQFNSGLLRHPRFVRWHLEKQ